ncbi:phosphate acetyltransferase [Enterobacteriaceae endosymbiont of Donacia proxima]|uniref:phosphate acetyltransferase n=1 Tax=Enterobacteriaceae endosymbiont of Donacia proxima TaxID=2675782 RepID=UPI0014495C5E|nr:phosphate acetyltransferase [Enterobacteriaceae endosymbiont of Donacia proxima]QJC35154.1 phosphate acetyltransferase [Enterobacteriaceae endosymbiont of Donacia proxima]
MFKKKIIISIPIDVDIHFFTSINLSLLKIINSNQLKCNFFKPISKIENYNFNYTNNILNIYNFSNIKSINPIEINNINLLKKNIEYNNIIDHIIQKSYKNINNTDFLFIEGIIPVYIKQLIFQLNCDLANIFNAKIIFVTSIPLINKNLEKIESKINILFKKKINNFDIKNTYLFIKYKNQNSNPFFYNLNIFKHFFYIKKNNFVHKKILSYKKKNIILIPWLKNFVFGINVKLICNHLNCSIINNNKYKKIKYIIYLDKKIFINPQKFCKSLLVISFKDYEVIKIIYKMLFKNIFFNTILFTDFKKNDKNCKYNLINKIIKIIIKNNISLFYIKDNLYNIFSELENIYKYDFPISDTSLITNIINYIKLYIPTTIFNKKDFNYKFYISPFIFKYNLINEASKFKKAILLPEGNEIRTLQAASICSKKNIANCILLGKTKEIISIAKKNNINISHINIIDPDLIRNDYIEKLIYIRKNKLLNEYEAIQLLKDNMFLATMMLKENKVDGIVSGANTTTANTIRPALQIIKTLSKYSIISSIFIMLLSNSILIYSDCAINPNPNYKQLAEIAIQSVETSRLFNFKPKVAMISYSTGRSAKGIEVEKVYKATKLVKNKLPNLLIDGPLQYDAAIINSVAKYKAPNSLVAGKANIIIFPDLNTGNTTYKAVQRSSNAISIGPILQGITKPINDLSRGASIEDIIYTIAVTVIQAQSIKNN